jgi:class 3 adenylate cyclase/tetratricopeptide (TPR) repeat protein
MFADMVEFTVLTQTNETTALQILEAHKRRLRPIFAKYDGHEVKTMGDAFLVEFQSALRAVTCAIEIQRTMERAKPIPKVGKKIQLRIGIHVGDVVHRGGDIFGDAVNIASRIERLAEPGGICISRQVFDQVWNKVNNQIIGLGELELKHVEQPIGIYLVSSQVKARPTQTKRLADQPSASIVRFEEPRWRTQLVDRLPEKTKLQDAFENMMSHKPMIITLRGESGVGKTRLMEEPAVFARLKNAVTLSGSARKEVLPYGPWVELARQYITSVDPALMRKMLGIYASDIARLIPDVVERIGPIAPSRPLDEGQDRIRLFEAVTQFLVAVSTHTPLLLLFDDMQFADQSSLDLLEYFARGIRHCRTLIVCAYTPEDVKSGSPLYETFTKLTKLRLLDSISLNNLTKEETANMIKLTFREQTVSKEFLNLIYTRTEGNPFFVEEVLRSLLEEGVIFRTETGWNQKPVSEITVPYSVRGTLTSRLTKLGPEVVETLQWAALIGSEFGFDLLREAMQADDEVLLARIEAALFAGVVLEIPDQRGNFRFADNRIRELLADDLSQLRQAKYHLIIARVIEKLHHQNLQPHAEALANHFAETFETEQAIKYSVMAGDRNLSIHAHEQAIQNFKRAADLMEREGREGDRAIIIEKLADACFFAGEPADKTLTLYGTALELYRKLPDNKSCSRISIRMADTAYRAAGGGAESIRKAISALKNGLDYLQGDVDSQEASRVYSRIANWAAELDDWKEANIWIEKALHAGEKSKNFDSVAEALATKGANLADMGETVEGLVLLQRALELASRQENHMQTSYDLLNLSIYTYPRDLVKAHDLAVRRLELSKQMNLIVVEASSHAWLSHLDWLGGDWKAALDENDKALEIWERLGFHFSVLGEPLRAWIHLGAGELEQAEEYLRRAAARGDPKISDIVAVNLGFGKLRLEQNRTDEATKHFEKCVDAFKDLEFTTFPLHHIEVLLHLASIYTEKDMERASAVCERATRIAEKLQSDAGSAMAFQARAVLQTAMRDEEATETYLKSLDAWEKARWPYYHAKALAAFGESLIETSPVQARQRLEQAANEFRTLGAKRDLEKIKSS